MLRWTAEVPQMLQVLSASAVDKECVPIEHHQIKIKNHITCSKPPVNANKFCWKHCWINHFIKILGCKSYQTQGESPHFFFALRRVELGFATATYTATVHGPMAQQVAGDDTTGIIRGCGCMWVGQQVTIRTTSALKILGCESRAACGIKLRCFTEPEIVGNFESA